MTNQILNEKIEYPSILVVEDDIDTREMLETLLRTNHYQPVLVSSGEQALEAITHQPIDMVVLDLGLPGMSGYDVCEQIRASDTPDVPIIMITASLELNGSVRGLRLGADDYVRKPFLTQELLERITTLRRRDTRARELIIENKALHQAIMLAQSQSETEVVLRRELTHNVATHLQALHRVIESEYRRQTNPAVRETVQRILGRVRGAVLVYETSEVLQDDPTDADALIRTLAAALKSIYSPRRRLPVEFRGGEVYLPLSVATPLALIANELISNAFRHAFPDQRFGTLTLTYGIEGDHFAFDVEDDGVGMPDQRTAQGRGVPTIQSLVAQIGGTVAWVPGAERGTVVQLRLPTTFADGQS